MISEAEPYTGDLPLAASWLEARLRARGISSPVAGAMASIPRHHYAPRVRWRVVYSDVAIWTGLTWMTPPGTVARALDAVDGTAGRRTLEIGTGTGYQSAVLAALGRTVTSLDISMACTEFARRHATEATRERVKFVTADGMRWTEHEERYDAIIVNAALRDVPFRLLSLLQPDGGVVLAPLVVADGSQRLVRMRSYERVQVLDLGLCRFPLIES